MKKALLTGAALVAMAFAMGSAVRAADVVTEPVAEVDWSGLYVGLHLGYAWANLSGCYDCTDTSSILDAEELDLEGIVGGLHAGYNWQMDEFVFGLEGDVSLTDLSDSEDAPDSDENENQSADVDLLASVRARLGIAFDDSLLYVTGGIAIPDASWDADGTGDNDGGVDFDDIGGVVGGGVEYAMSETIRLRVEGLYYFFDDKEGIEDITDANTGEEIEFDDAIVVRGGVSFYFN